MVTQHKRPPVELEQLATEYASYHMRRDSGVESIYYLPAMPDSPSRRDIRLIEVNSLLDDSSTESMEPFYFGINVGTQDEHWLYTLDVTPRQWQQILRQELSLPQGWSLDQRVEFKPGKRGNRIT